MKEAIDAENIVDIKKRIADIHDDIEHILYNTQLAVAEDIPPEKAAQIKNIVLELEKLSLNLGSAVTLEHKESAADA